jgi:hypothetical protein
VKSNIAVDPSGVGPTVHPALPRVLASHRRRQSSGLAHGNPVRVRSCPAAVLGRDAPAKHGAVRPASSAAPAGAGTPKSVLTRGSGRVLRADGDTSGSGAPDSWSKKESNERKNGCPRELARLRVRQSLRHGPAVAPSGRPSYD